MKTVFSNAREVAHVWAQRSQSEGRTSSGNVYFHNRTIYSYGSHFPMAHLCNPEKHGFLAIYNKDDYSVTTSKHQGFVRMSSSQYRALYTTTEILQLFIAVEDKSDDYAKRQRKELKDLVTRHTMAFITSQSASAARRRKEELKIDDINEAREFYRNQTEILGLLGLAMPPKVTDRLTMLEADPALVNEEAKRDNERRKKAEAAKRRKEQKRREKLATEALPLWREGDNSHEVRSHLYASKTIRLRYLPKSDVVETSQGAKFPAGQGFKAFEMIKACRDNETTFEANGKTIHLGHYSIDKIDAAGNVTAGCHYVEFAEIELAYNQMKSARVA